VVNLLATHGGDYAAACALDFSDPPLYYDTFALRDSDGARTISKTWPYFLSPRPRSAITSESDDVPVQSCWNGMVAFNAAPFYSSPALQFRGLPDTPAAHHLEASECCLIHMDNPLSAQKGVYLNTNVRVGYNPKASGPCILRMEHGRYGGRECLERGGIGGRGGLVGHSRNWSKGSLIAGCGIGCVGSYRGKWGACVLSTRCRLLFIMDGSMSEAP